MRQGAGAVIDLDRIRAIKRNFRNEFFAEQFIANDKIGNDLVLVARDDARPFAPRQKFRVMFDSRDEVEHLYGAIGEKASFLMFGHVTRYNLI